MKSLTLTIHPHLEGTNLNPDEIRQGRVTTLALMKAKRLTDAELAAERWHAQSEYLQEATLATTTSLALPRIGALMEMQAVAATLLRFATSPHYFEEAA